ncbi:MAG: iron-containing alcohol dehydrogenase [Bacteroidales bacterium]
MENFIAYNPTKLHFGKDVVKDLGTTIERIGKNVLFMYGKGSIQKNGIYDAVIEQLESIGANVTEYSGIKSNPVVEDVERAAELGILKHTDVILAVGGGSVIDSAKITGLSIANHTKPWSYMKQQVKPQKTIPLVAVLTVAATGTEMNPAAVLQNPKTGEKLGYVHPLNYPRHSFLDPAYTQSVPANYTAYGVADLIAHSFEAYFGSGEATLSDRFVEAIVKEAMEYGPQLLNNLEDYELRAKIMWAATNALNGLTNYGRKAGDWGVHDIGHNLSLLFDMPHGATLSIVYPAWLKEMKQHIPDRIAELGKQLFDVDSAEETIYKLEQMFVAIDCPIRLQDMDISKEKQEEITELMLKNQVNGYVHQLNDEQRKAIVTNMFAEK